jgi:hypothetical protein
MSGHFDLNEESHGSVAGTKNTVMAALAVSTP